MNPDIQSDSDRRLRQYEALLDAAAALGGHADLSALFGNLAGRLCPAAGCEFMSILLHDSSTNVMRLHVLGSEPPRVLGGPDVAPEQSPGGWAWMTQEAILIADYEREDRFPLLTPVWRGHGMRSGYY